MSNGNNPNPPGQANDPALPSQNERLIAATLSIVSSFVFIKVTGTEGIDPSTVKAAADIAEDWYDECARRGWLPQREV